MKSKQTLILLVLAVALVAAAIYYKGREEQAIQTAASPTRTITEGLTSATVDRIEIKAPETTAVTLTKLDGVWYMNAANKFRADKNHIAGIFNAIEKEISGEVVSSNPKNFGEFEVDETSATHVQVFGKDKSIADLYIGKAGPSFMSTFIRKAGTDEVVDAKASLGFAFKKPEGWRDTQILDIPVDEIVGISAEGTSSTWELKKVDENWNVVKPVQKTAQSMKAQSLSTALSVLRSTGFVEKESTKTLTQLGLDPPKQKYTITHEDRSTSPAKEQTTVLLVGEMEGPSKSYFVKRADRDDLFTIAEFQASNLAATLDQLVPPEPKPAPTPATTGTVEASAPAEAPAKATETSLTVEAASVTSETK